jgi:hypothetical protein
MVQAARTSFILYRRAICGFLIVNALTTYMPIRDKMPGKYTNSNAEMRYRLMGVDVVRGQDALKRIRSHGARAVWSSEPGIRQ